MLQRGTFDVDITVVSAEKNGMKFEAESSIRQLVARDFERMGLKPSALQSPRLKVGQTTAKIRLIHGKLGAGAGFIRNTAVDMASRSQHGRCRDQTIAAGRDMLVGIDGSSCGAVERNRDLLLDVGAGLADPAIESGRHLNMGIGLDATSALVERTVTFALLCAPRHASAPVPSLVNS